MHTLGPWTLKHNQYIVDKNDEFVVSLGGYWYPSEEQFATFKANARLIAAAPDLLEAAEYAVDGLGQIFGLSPLIKAIEKAKKE